MSADANATSITEEVICSYYNGKQRLQRSGFQINTPHLGLKKPEQTECQKDGNAAIGVILCLELSVCVSDRFSACLGTISLAFIVEIIGINQPRTTGTFALQLWIGLIRFASILEVFFETFWKRQTGRFLRFTDLHFVDLASDLRHRLHLFLFLLELFTIFAPLTRPGILTLLGVAIKHFADQLAELFRIVPVVVDQLPERHYVCGDEACVGAEEFRTTVRNKPIETPEKKTTFVPVLLATSAMFRLMIARFVIKAFEKRAVFKKTFHNGSFLP